MHEGILYSFNKSATGSKIDEPETGYYWNDYQYNYVIQCTEDGCEKSELDKTKSCLGNGGKIIDFGYVLGFCQYDEENFIPTILSKLSESEKSKGNAESPFDSTNDYYYLIKDNYSLKINTESEKIDLVDINGVTYDCENGRCNNGLKNLPVCDINCKIDSKEITDSSFCINSSSSKIYKKVNNNCSLTYGNSSSGEGIHIFDISDSENAIELNIDSVDEWSSPKLVMYNCNSNNCTQSSGYIRHIDTFYKIDESSSVKMKTDNKELYCTISMNTYILDDFVSGGSTATFQPCIKVTRGASVAYKFANIIINKNEIGLFLFEQSGGEDEGKKNKLLKINNNIITYETSITEGYYVNAGSVYSSGEVAVGKDALIYCKNSNVDECVTLPAIPGYYLNAGSDKTKKPVIQCNGTECKSISIETTECGSGKQVAGGLILNSNTVKVCLDNGSSVEISKRVDVGYKSITLASAKDFPQTSTTNTNISVKLGKNGSVTILEKGGLPECSITETGICFEGATANQYCINGNKIFKTVSGGCQELTAIEAEDLPECTNTSRGEVCFEDAVVDQYCKTDGKLYITKTNDCEEFTGTYNKAVYFNFLYEKVTKDNGVVGYQCSFTGVTQSSCTLITGYAVNDNKIVQCSGWNGEGCTVTSTGSSNSCSSSDVGKITADGKKICFGSSSEITLPTEPGSPINVAFVPTDMSSIYGRNKNEVTFLTVTTNTVYVTETITAGYYLNKAVSSGKSKALIYCSGNTIGTCEVRDALNGYYDSKYGLIKCDNTGCSITTLPSACSSKDEVIYDEGYKMCVTDDQSHTTTPQNICTAVTNEYESINVKANVFPGISTKSVITVKCDIAENTALVMEDATLPLCDTVDTAKSCTSSNTIVPACITSAKKIYLTENGSCNMVSSTEESKYIYFDGNNKVVSSPFTASSGEIAFAYKCTFTTSDNVSYALDTCKISKGYTISGGRYIQCSGWKYDTCIKGDLPKSTTCSGSNVVLGSSTLLCANTNEITIPYSPNVDTASLILERPSSNFGSPAGVVFLSLSESEIVVTSAPTVAGYYINQNYVSSGTAKQLIKCIVSGSSSTCKELESDVIASVGGFVYPSALDTTGKKLISCETDSTCESIDGSTTVGQVYIDASQANNTGASKSLIVCTNDDGCKSIVKTTGTYINAIDNSKLIECGTTECKLKTITYTSGVYSVEDGLDKNNTITCIVNGQCISGKIIGTNCKTPIDSTKLCTYGSNDQTINLPLNYYCMTSGNIYLSSEGNKCTQITNKVILIQKVNGMYKKVSPGAVTTGIIYKCSAGGDCTQVVGTNYLFEEEKNKYLYTCAESGDCVLKSECEVGRYLSDIQNKLIECEDSNINNCKVKNISSDYNGKYFVDLAKNGNVIKCTGDVCESVKGSTQQGHAYKDGFTIDKVIICDSESCHSTQASNNGYYIDASNDNYENIFTCDTNCGEASVGTEKYLDATNNNYTINCSGSICVSKPECRVSVGSSECKDKTYYRVKDKTDYILETNSDVQTAYLFYCLKNSSTGAMECSEVQDYGYFINTSSSEVISYIRVTDPDSRLICTSISAATGCSSYGDVYKNENNNWSICLTDTGISAELTSTPVNYIIQNQSDNNPNPNSIVKVGENSITFVEDYDFQKDYYVYVEKSSNKVLVSGSIPEDIQNEPSLVDEYKCEGGDTNACMIVDENN